MTTASPEAQRYFDQGLCFLYAFNHDEAVRSFRQAAELDPGCAMAWWGVAIALGPHINNPLVPEERGKAAWEAIEKARSRQDAAGAVERALIEAASKRYAGPSRRIARRSTRRTPRRWRRSGGTIPGMRTSGRSTPRP